MIRKKINQSDHGIKEFPAVKIENNHHISKVETKETEVVFDSSIGIIIIGALSFITFFNTIFCEFAWDDRVAIISNKDIRGRSNIWDCFLHDFWGQDITKPDSHKSYRPLTVLSFRLNYTLFGTQPWIYHLTNVILHMITSALVYQCGRVIFKNNTSAIVSALLFATHPVHCDAVASIVGRADILCTMFSLVSFLQYLSSICKAGRPSFTNLLLSYLFTICGTLSKEQGITVVGIFIVYEVQFIICKITRKNSPILNKSIDVSSCIYRIISSLVFVYIFMAARLRLHGDHLLYKWTILENQISLLPFGIPKILSYAHMHAWYLYKLFWPRELCYDYGFDTIPLIERVSDPRNILTCLAYAAVILVVIFSLCKIQTPLLLIVSFGVIPFLPASNIFFPVGTVLAERLLYFPSIGFCFGISYYLYSHLVLSSKCKKIRDMAVQVIIFLYVVQSIQRNNAWKDEKSLFHAAIQVAPNNVKVLNNYAKTLLNEKEASEAVRYLEHALELFPNYSSALLNLGIAYNILQQPLHAVQKLRAALQYRPHDSQIHGYLGSSMMKLWENHRENDASIGYEQLDEAIHHLDVSITAQDVLPAIYYTRGRASMLKNDHQQAIRYFRMAMEANNKIAAQGIDLDTRVEDDKIYNNIGILLMEIGEYDKAIVEFALIIAPSSYELLNNVALAHNKLGDYKVAMEKYERALHLHPKDAILWTNAGYALETSGDLKTAKKYYTEAYTLDPKHPQIQTNLLNLLKKLGE